MSDVSKVRGMAKPFLDPLEKKIKALKPKNKDATESARIIPETTVYFNKDGKEIRDEMIEYKYNLCGIFLPYDSKRIAACDRLIIKILVTKGSLFKKSQFFSVTAFYGVKFDNGKKVSVYNAKSKLSELEKQLKAFGFSVEACDANSSTEYNKKLLHDEFVLKDNSTDFALFIERNWNISPEDAREPAMFLDQAIKSFNKDFVEGLSPILESIFKIIGNAGIELVK